MREDEALNQAELGFDELEVLRVLSTLTPVNGRFETIHSPKGWTAIVDYAHTPPSRDRERVSVPRPVFHEARWGTNLLFSVQVR